MKTKANRPPRRITPAAKAAAKQFCTYTPQEKCTEEYLAEIIQGVIDRVQVGMAVGFAMQDNPAGCPAEKEV